MSFAALEESTEDGQPVELYTFGYQGGTFRYTTADRDMVVGSSTFLQQPGMSRSELDETGEISKSNLMITAPSDFEVAKLFEVYPPSDVVDLIVQRVHYSDLSDVATIWLGRVIGVAWNGETCSVSCESVFTRLRAPGLRRAYGRNCAHLLYGPNCRVVQATYQVNANLNGISSSGFVVSSPTFNSLASGYLTGGKLRFEISAGVFEYRGIREHSGADVTMSHPIPGLQTTSAVSVFPGCDKTKATCIAKFNNLPNYGGFPYVPEKNPFVSSPF